MEQLERQVADAVDRAHAVAEATGKVEEESTKMVQVCERSPHCTLCLLVLLILFVRRFRYVAGQAVALSP